MLDVLLQLINKHIINHQDYPYVSVTGNGTHNSVIVRVAFNMILLSNKLIVIFTTNI